MADSNILSALIGASAGAVTTCIGWIVTYRLAKRQQYRKDQLDLVNRQITELYGPLHIACEAGRNAYDALCKKFGVKQIFVDGRPVSPQAGDEWSLWMNDIFTPLNDRLEKLIMEKLYLLEETEVPVDFHTFMKHVALNKIILLKWKNGDKTEQYAREEFPKTLDGYAKGALEKAKRKQAELIGKVSR
jgi:hypothetical protein